MELKGKKGINPVFLEIQGPPLVPKRGPFMAVRRGFSKFDVSIDVPTPCFHMYFSKGVFSDPCSSCVFHLAKYSHFTKSS